MSAIVRQMLAIVRPTLAIVGPMLAIVGQTSSAIMGPTLVLIGPTLALIGPTPASVGPMLAIIGPLLAIIRPTLAIAGSTLAIVGPTTAKYEHCSSQQILACKHHSIFGHPNSILGMMGWWQQTNNPLLYHNNPLLYHNNTYDSTIFLVFVAKMLGEGCLKHCNVSYFARTQSNWAGLAHYGAMPEAEVVECATTTKRCILCAIHQCTTTIKTCLRSLCAYIHPWLNGPQSDGNFCHALCPRRYHF